MAAEPEALAKAFHEAYERLAPSFGYATRVESAIPWEEVPEQNRLLMIAVAAEVLDYLEAITDPKVAEQFARQVRGRHSPEKLDELVELIRRT
ncbi:unnamed protein product [marine sediment metagenome]|uniref:Uncharacterized protein n=1 Tax=marine sediment metagenome TaxID=412755 RepID=X0WUD5_9ZZZZ